MNEAASSAFGAPEPAPEGEADAEGGAVPSGDVVDDAAAPEPDESSGSPSDSAAAEPDDEGALSPDGTADSQVPQESSKLDNVLAALDRIQAQVHGFHERAENYEQIIRQMQSRIEALQGDQVQALLRPVIQRFAGLHAQAMEASERARDHGEAAEKDFNFFAVAIEEALGLIDIESVSAAPSVEFDPRKHHAVRTVPTDDAALDKLVQRVLRQGFTYAGAPRVFLPAQVSVYRFEQEQPVADAPTPDTSPTSEPGEGEPNG
ncbi:MAG: nucleotide exchange factor GrpE [Candidatus Nanopelagicales bacterium]